jgi:hypothetical protein
VKTHQTTINTTCVCQLGPCFRCELGQHDRCWQTGPPVAEALLGRPDGWAYRHPDGRVVYVWLADRTCHAMCPCGCRKDAQQRGLLFDLSTATPERHSSA